MSLLLLETGGTDNLLLEISDNLLLDDAAVFLDDTIASILGIDLPWMHVYPDPTNGAFDANDLQQIAYKYRGILASSGTSFVPHLKLMGCG